MNLLKKLLTMPVFSSQSQSSQSNNLSIDPNESGTSALVKYEQVEQAQRSIDIDWDRQDPYSVINRLNVICIVVGGFITRYSTLEKTIILSPPGRHSDAMEYVHRVLGQHLRLQGSHPGHNIYRCEAQVRQVRQVNEAFFRQFLQNLESNLANRTHSRGAGAISIALHIQAKERFIADVNSLTTYAKGIITATQTIQEDIRMKRNWENSYVPAPEEMMRGYRQALAVLEIQPTLEPTVANDMLRRLEKFRVYVIESLQPY